MALSSAAKLVDCLLLHEEKINDEFLENQLKDGINKIKLSLKKYQAKHCLHKYWEQYFFYQFNALPFRLTPEQEISYKRGVVLEIAKACGFEVKGISYLGAGFAAVAIAVVLSASVAAFSAAL